jgi:CubicO group peptidase (beta-lactamase class C family)/membrane protease YdiL (CAAX protease family)
LQSMRRFATMRPLPFVILATVAWILVAGLAALVAAWALQTPLADLLPRSLGTLTATACLLVVMGRWGWLRAAGVAAPGSWRLWLVTAGLAVYVVVAYQVAFFGGIALNVSSFSGSGGAQAVLARQVVVTVAEEFLFRGFLLYALVRVWGDSRRSLLAAVTVPALIFGLAHAPQVLAGNPLDDTLMTMLNCFVCGLWWGTLLLLGGSIWPAVLIHAASNASFQITALSLGGVDPTAADYAAATLAELPLVIAGLWLLLRKVPGSNRLEGGERKERTRSMKPRPFFPLLIVLSLALVGCGTPAAAPATVTPDQLAQSLATFERELEALRQDLKIPGLSAAVVKDGQLVWARGLGLAGVENRVPATPETPYHLASVTKPFAALAIMQLVQDGKLTLDDPVSRYGVTLPEGGAVTVRHLMSHTSAGTPGARFRYDGTRYGLLSQVVLAATGRSLQDWLFERILSPLGMDDTVPAPPATCAGLPFAPACDRVHAALARPYLLDGELNPVPGFYQDSVNAGAGLVSTVADLAEFDAALDANTLVPAATKELMFTPTVSTSGQELPYGLGWFTQSYRGTRLIWHTGYSPPSTSALFLKLPEQGLTFVVLANTDGLSRPFAAAMGGGDVLGSLVAVTFYKHLVLAPQYGQPLPAIDWSAYSSTVLAAISQVEDETLRDLLDREYQALRALAGSLADVRARVEQIARMRATAEEVARSLDPRTLDLYAGTYEFAGMGGVTLSVERAGDKLYMDVPGQPPQELLPLSETRFFMPAGLDVYQFDFTLDEPGQTCRLVLTLGNMSFTGWRS